MKEIIKEIIKDVIIISAFLILFLFLGILIYNSLIEAEERRNDIKEINTIGAETVELLIKQNKGEYLIDSIFSSKTQEERIKEAYTSEACTILTNETNINNRIINFIEQNKTTIEDIKLCVSNKTYNNLKEILRSD